MGLLDFFSSKPKPQPQQQPGGLLNVPSGNQQQAYKDYAESCMMKGHQPLPFADWQKQQAAQPKK